MTTELVTDPDYRELEVIAFNKNLKHCPYTPPVMKPGKLQGQVSIEYRPCGSWCIHFNKTVHTIDKNKCTVKLTCGKSEIIFNDVKCSDPIDADNALKLIK